MSVIWNKVWYDLWNNKIRTLLAALSIAAGVFAVGATVGMGDQLLSGMDASHQAVVPSHFSMWLTDPISEDELATLKKVDGVEDVEAFNQILVRYKIEADDEWETAILNMEADYEDQQYDIIELKEGVWPKKNHIGIERLSSQYFELDIGDSVIFELPNGAERSLPISGKIRHPFVPPPEFGGQAYFFVDGEGLERFDVEEGQFYTIKARVDPYSASYTRQVASDVKDQLAKMNVGVGGTVYQDPEKHWGRMFVEGINLVLQLLAVVSLLMSVVLVLNTLTALITQQTDQIGIIKAIGGRTSTLVQLYLVGILVYGAIALFIALPLGSFLAFGLTQWFLNLFNIDYDTFTLSTTAVILMVAAALGVPLLAALFPVLKGSAITVREAIASYGLGGDFGSSWLDRAVESIGQRFLPSPHAIALGNMVRRKGRLVLTLLVLVTAGAMFLIVMSLSSSITLTLDHDLGRRNYDLTLFFDERQRVERSEDMAYSLPEVEKAELWFTQGASILLDGQHTQDAGLRTELVGVPPGSDVYQPMVIDGRWLREDDQRAVVISQQMSVDNNIPVGAIITVDPGELGRKADWQVVGIYSLVFGGGFSTESLYAPEEYVWDATNKYNQGSQLYVRTHDQDATTVDMVDAELKDLFKARNMEVGYSESLHVYREQADSQFGIFVGMLLALALIVAMVGGVGLMGSLWIGVVERIREIGVLRAIGARSGVIMGMFVLEGVMQGVLSRLIAVPVAFIVGGPVATALGKVMFEANLDYRFNLGAVLFWLVAVVIISALASLIPARRASKISVRESLAYA